MDIDRQANPDIDPDETQEDLTMLRDSDDEFLDSQRYVLDEDLSTNDLIQDGAAPEDLEQPDFGRFALEHDEMYPGHQDTIDERIREEEPDPNSSIVPELGHDYLAE